MPLFSITTTTCFNYVYIYILQIYICAKWTASGLLYQQVAQATIRYPLLSSDIPKTCIQLKWVKIPKTSQDHEISGSESASKAFPHPSSLQKSITLCREWDFRLAMAGDWTDESQTLKTPRLMDRAIRANCKPQLSKNASRACELGGN